jgi:hypothetical protein
MAMLGQNIPKWIIESKSVNASNQVYIEYEFTGAFPDTPYVTATGLGVAGVDLDITLLTKDKVGITISGPVPGLKVQIHAMGLDEPGECYGQCSPTFEDGPCTS